MPILKTIIHLFIIEKLNRGFFTYIIILSLLIVLFLIHISIGKVNFSLSDWLFFLNYNEPSNVLFNQIIIYNRIPTALTAILAGGALSISGMQMQTLFRNPVAGPFVLGISSGASLFVALFLMSTAFIGITFVDFPILQNSSLILFAFLGSFIFALLILYISRKVSSVSTVLIVGLLLSGIASAIVTLLESIADKNALQNFVFWSFGSFQNLSYGQICIFFIVIIIGIIISLFTLKSSNLIQINDEFAKQNGVNINKIKTLLIISSTLLASAVTAYCGPIAFIGLAVPHLCRTLLKTSDHIKLYPFVFLMGSLICLCCSVIINLPFIEINIPINVITSIIGGPLVIYIILSKPIEYR
jgi:iron complex transport system permease protein